MGPKLYNFSIVDAAISNRDQCRLLDRFTVVILSAFIKLQQSNTVLMCQCNVGNRQTDRQQFVVGVDND